EEPAKAPSPPPAADEKVVRVTDAGAEPRALRTYAFVANKVDKRIVTIVQDQHRADEPGAALAFTFVANIDFTPKKVDATGTHFELKVTKVSISPAAIPPAQRPQMAKSLGDLTGLTGGFDVTPRGEIGEV